MTPPPDRKTESTALGPQETDPQVEFKERWRHDMLRRLILLALTILGSVAVAQWGRADELAHVIRHVALVSISLLADWFLVLVLFDLSSVAWCYWTVRESIDPNKKAEDNFGTRLIRSINRHMGHAEALIVCVTFVLVQWPVIWIQIPAVALLMLFPVPLMEKAVVRIDPQTAGEPGDRMWLRRPMFYVLAVGGLAALWTQANGQHGPLMRLTLVIGLASLVRFTTWLLWYRSIWKSETRKHEGVRTTIRQKIGKHGPGWDRLVIVGVLAVAVAGPVIPLARAGREAARAFQVRNVEWRSCGTDKRGPIERQVSLFLVADSQFHELAGKRDGTHVDLIDSLVPVAVRPVELDLLSGVTLSHFAELYQRERALFETGRRQADDKDAKMLWAHLGDVADLGCQTELARLKAYMPKFGSGLLAALVPGNHDSTFTGNFSWHPDWTESGACPRRGDFSGPLIRTGEKGTNQRFFDLSQGYLADAERASTSPDPAFGYLARVTRLGTMKVGTGSAGKGVAVLGAFLDSSDYGMFRLGIAGLQGDLSSAQVAWVTQRLDLDKEALVLLFMHHPFDEISLTAQWALQGLAAHLRGNLLGIVSAHTHLAGLRHHCMDGARLVPEFVLGSVTDPPQEAAILDVGPDADGKPAVRVTTIPAVSRAELDCAGPDPSPPPDSSAPPGSDPRVSAKTCQEVLKNLRTECGPLFWDDARTLRENSACKEYVGSWWPSLEPGDDPPSPDPAKVKCMQQDRAWRVLECVRRHLPKQAVLPRQPLDQQWKDDQGKVYEGNVFDLIDEVYSHSGSERQELVCLSWVASVLQAHKARGWGFPQAMDFSLDRLVTFGARRMDADSKDEALCPIPAAVARN